MLFVDLLPDIPLKLGVEELNDFESLSVFAEVPSSYIMAPFQLSVFMVAGRLLAMSFRTACPPGLLVW